MQTKRAGKGSDYSDSGKVLPTHESYKIWQKWQQKVMTMNKLACLLDHTLSHLKNNRDVNKRAQKINAAKRHPLCVSLGFHFERAGKTNRSHAGHVMTSHGRSRNETMYSQTTALTVCHSMISDKQNPFSCLFDYK